MFFSLRCYDLCIAVFLIFHRVHCLGFRELSFLPRDKHVINLNIKLYDVSVKLFLHVVGGGSVEFYHMWDWIYGFVCHTNDNMWTLVFVFVVGGGSAGCVLASRLSEDPNIKVLLLEAGEEESKFSRLVDEPYSALSLRTNSHVVWNDSTVTQKHACQSMRDKVWHWSFITNSSRSRILP